MAAATMPDLTTLLEKLSKARIGLTDAQRKKAVSRACDLVENDDPGVASKGIEAALEWDKLGLSRDKMVLDAVLDMQGGGRKAGMIVGGNVNVLQVTEQERAGIVAELLERARSRLAIQGNGHANGESDAAR